jgi:hypothetical protein
MLDVILYRYDRRGRLRLRERTFHSMLGLAHFFASRRSLPWEWAEVTITTNDGIRRNARYSADDLRAIIEGSGSGPSPN